MTLRLSGDVCPLRVVSFVKAVHVEIETGKAEASHVGTESVCVVQVTRRVVLGAGGGWAGVDIKTPVRTTCRSFY